MGPITKRSCGAYPRWEAVDQASCGCSWIVLASFNLSVVFLERKRSKENGESGPPLDGFSRHGERSGLNGPSLEGVESQPRAESAQHIADGCRWKCEAAMPRIGLTTGRVGAVDPDLLLTVYLVTVSEPERMAGDRKV